LATDKADEKQADQHEEAMNAVDKNIATARGEAMAASLLASAAMQVAFAVVADRKGLLTKISEEIDDVLNHSGPARGDAGDEFNTFIREIARVSAMRSLDAMRQMLDNPPT
jgi:hypothetical protein